MLASREAWNEGQEFAEEYENKKGRVKERKFGPPNSVPAAVDRLRQTLRESASGSDSEASNASAEGSGFMVKAVEQEQAVTHTSVKSTPVVIPTPAQQIFTEQDFPPLSSSESEGPASPPRPSAKKNARQQQQSRNFQIEGGLERKGVGARETGRGSNTPGPKSISPHRANELLRESAALPGRGRAGALLRHAAMPALRLPAEDTSFAGGYSCHRGEQTASERYDPLRNEFLFPADDELLAAPEIIPVPRNQISGGTQVRIRQA